MVNPSAENNEMCAGCSACAESCPVHCIHMKYDEEGFLYPSVDTAQCINCRKCEHVCPLLNSKHSSDLEASKASSYAIICNDSTIFQASSSGGAFSMIARHALANGWYVAGAVWTKDWKVKHVVTNDPEEVLRMAGTKYLQSEMGEVYSNVRTLLESGTHVLFCGTGCQVAGLNRYLRKKYNQLLTINIACYGAPSPVIWQKYLRELQRRYALGNIREVHFRRKINGSAMNMQVIGSQGTYNNQVYEDPFGWGLIKAVLDRPCCRSCRFKGAASGSDITIGDAWGVSEIIPELEPNRGISITLCHNQKSKQHINNIRSECKLFEELPLEESIRRNMGIVPCEHSGAEMRKEFFRRYHSNRSIRRSLMRLKCGTRKNFFKWLLQDFIEFIQSKLPCRFLR